MALLGSGCSAWVDLDRPFSTNDQLDYSPFAFLRTSARHVWAGLRKKQTNFFDGMVGTPTVLSSLNKKKFVRYAPTLTVSLSC